MMETEPGGIADPVDKGRIRQDNEAIIIPAAERVFARYGFRGTTMQQIADAAALPKANLHYYFGNKHNLYLCVLARILEEWLAPLEAISADAAPKAALEAYVLKKVRFSFTRPEASRLFASEVMQGAQVVNGLLKTALRTLVEEKARILDGWIAAGKLRPLDTTHFFFTVWSITQSYADFDIQMAAILDDAKSEAAEARATQHVLSCVWRICGLE
nr:TetR family transcriptional regulator C-terminal domain-containing protein [uncultured Enterobacter sp.]